MSLFSSWFNPFPQPSLEKLRDVISRAPVRSVSVGIFKSPKVTLYKEDGSVVGTVDLRLDSYSDANVRAKLMELKPALHIYAYKVVGDESGHPFAGQIMVL